MDLAYDWNAASNGFPSLEEVKAFLRNGMPPTDRQLSLDPPPLFAFSDEQNQRLALLDDQIAYLKNPSNATIIPKKLTMTQGKAGCGKSTLIKEIVRRVAQEFGEEAVVVAAPTGQAAINIDGKTLHSQFLIPKSSAKFADLSGQRQLDFQNEMAQVKFIIVDEMSMVGLEMLHFIERRCRESRQETHGPTRFEAFGDLMVWFFGDFRQLPPIGDKAMYDTRPGNDNHALGRVVFSKFQEFVELTVCHRQSGNESEQFRTVLDNIANGAVTTEDHALLMTRRKELLSPAERVTFESALHIYPTNDKAIRRNDDVLRATNLPVARIASRNLPDYRDQSTRPANLEIEEGLIHILNLQVGCRVMLRNNISVRHGLANSTMGTVRAIVYAPGDLPPMLPDYILVEFDGYQGPFFPSGTRFFPVVPITRNWKKGNVTHYRTQLPLMVGYASTIHKSQGLTLDKVVVDIGSSEKNLGLTYVAYSRVKRLQDLMIESGFTKDRLDRINTDILKNRNKFITENFTNRHSH